MGKASSAKKVARAARAGGGPSRDKPKLGFPAAIVGIVVLGLLLVVFSYGQRNNRAEAEAPSSVNSDHWHVAYGVYVCDAFQEPIPDQGTDPVGIHTHGDGVIHIHPFSEASSGDNAQLHHFTDLVAIDFQDDAVTLPDGTTKTNGDDCNGEPGSWKLLWWPADDLGAEAIVRTDIGSFGDFRFPADRGALTLAFVPDSVDVNGLRPPTVPELDQLSDVTNDPDAGGIDPVDTTATTAAGAGGETTTTTVAPGDATTTTAASAGGETTTTTVAPGDATTTSTAASTETTASTTP